MISSRFRRLIGAAVLALVPSFALAQSGLQQPNDDRTKGPLDALPGVIGKFYANDLYLQQQFTNRFNALGPAAFLSLGTTPGSLADGGTLASEILRAQAMEALLAPRARQIGAAGLAVGGGDLTADRTITVPKASAADVAAGTDDAKALTALSVATAFANKQPISSNLTALSSGTITGVGTGPNTLAAGNDSRIVGATQNAAAAITGGSIGGTTDGSGINVAPSALGSITRTLNSWFFDRANVLAFAGNDLSIQFANACASLPPQGGTIYIPGRAYTVSGQLVCNKPVTVEGDGPHVTVLQFSSAMAGQAGLVFNLADVTLQATVRDLSLITLVDQVNGNAALTIKYPNVSGSVFKGPRVNNVDIGGDGNNLHYWANGIVFQDAWLFQIDDVKIRGKNNVTGATAFPADNMNAAISISGTVASDGTYFGCTDGKITNANVTFAKYAGYVNGHCEGLHWGHLTAVATDYGIVYPNSKATPSVYVTDSHINSYSGGVVLAGLQQGTIHDNLMYKWVGSGQDWIGVDLQCNTALSPAPCSSQNVIHDNTFFGFAPTTSGTSIGVRADASDGNIIHHNYMIQTTWGFDFQAQGTTNVVSDNVGSGITQGWQKTVGLNTISNNNTPVNAGNDAFYVPMSGGGTPNVGAFFQKVFLLGDLSAATYTDFTNAEIGRQITIIGQNGNSTIKNNSRLHLKSQQDFVSSQGSSLTLLYVGSYWQEIGRAQ